MANITPHSARRSLLIVAIGHGVRMGLAVFATALLGRHLDAADFGFFAWVAASLAIQLQLMELGTARHVTREIAQNQGRWRSPLAGYLSSRLWLGLIGAGIFVLYGWASHESGPERVVILALATSFPLVAVAGVTPLFDVRQQQGVATTLRTLAQFAFLVGIAVFVHWQVALAYIALWVPIRELFGAWSIFLWTRVRFGVPLPWSLSPRAAWEHLRQSWRLGLCAVLQLGYFYSDLYVVRACLGQELLGAYAAAFRPIHVLVVMPGLLFGPLFPILAKYAVHDPRRYRVWMLQLSRVMASLGIACLLFAWPLAEIVIDVLYGGHYQSGELNTVPAFRWLSVSFAAICWGAASVRGLLATGREGALVNISLVGFVANLVANLVLVPRYGFVAAAATTAVTEWGITCSALVLVARGNRLPIRFAFPLPRIVGFLILLGLLLSWLPVHSMLQITVAGTGFLAMIVLLFWRNPKFQFLQRELAKSRVEHE